MRPAYNPREVMKDAPERPIADLAKTTLAATLFLAFFHSAGLLRWTEALPVSTGSDYAVTLAARWHETMSYLSLDRPEKFLRQKATALKARP
jgi:hypothetical protein